MTYNVFGGTLNLAYSILNTVEPAFCFEAQRAIPSGNNLETAVSCQGCATYLVG